MSWLTSPWTDLGITAGKAALMYTTALAGLRVGERRTLAQWTAIDFAAAVAIGAIVGRTAIASNQSYAVGAVALATLIVIHRLASWARFQPLIRRLMDHRLRLLVVDGRLCRRQLRLCGLTDDDEFAALRERGVLDLATVPYLLYEVKGEVTIVRADQSAGDLLAAGLPSAVGNPASDTMESGPPADQ